MNLTLIVAFFASKKVSLITAFVCWTSNQMLELSRWCTVAQLRVRTVRDFSRLPALPAYDVHREGMLLDLGCPGAQDVLTEASKSRAFNLRHSWLLLQDASSDCASHNVSSIAGYNCTLIEDLPSNDDLDYILADIAILPDADVTVATGGDVLLDVYRVKEGEHLIRTALDIEGHTTQTVLNTLWAQRPTAVTRRKDLQNIYLKAEVILSQPQHFRGWDDLRDRQIDTYPKLTYPIMMRVAHDLNFRYNLRQVDSYGVSQNGSFDGLVGQLQRARIEIGVASMFMRADRWDVLHYCAETLELRGAFMFRQPSQSTVRNVFLLPFSRGVWLAVAVVSLLAGITLAALAYVLRKADPTLRHFNPAETFTFTVGTICQQGFHVTPTLLSARLVILATLITALSAFAAYSAKIVSILQSPSDAIRTIDDLTHSRMDLGVQETTYKKVYFAESTDPATQRLYRRKLLPLGEAAYLSVVDGIARMRSGSFAFQVEEASGYELISRTYTEREKCGLAQIQAFKLPMVSVPIRKHSGYRDLLAARLRWQRETGLMDQTGRVWRAAKVRCDAGGGGFLSVGLRDVLPALQILGDGAGLAAVILLAELAASFYQKHKESHRRVKQI